MRTLTLHGFTGSPSSWRRTTDGTHLELLGHGASVRARGGESFEGEVDRIAAAIAGHAPVHLAGYSLGARLALGVALARPDRIAALTLVGVHPGLADAGEREARRAADRRWIDLLEARGIDAFVREWEALPMWASQSSLPASVRERQRAERLAHDPGQLALALRALGLAEMPSYWDALPQLTMPTTLVAGAHDDKFQAIATAITTRVASATAIILEGCGHNPLLEAPERLAAALPTAS